MATSFYGQLWEMAFLACTALSLGGLGLFGQGFKLLWARRGLDSPPDARPALARIAIGAVMMAGLWGLHALPAYPDAMDTHITARVATNPGKPGVVLGTTALAMELYS